MKSITTAVLLLVLCTSAYSLPVENLSSTNDILKQLAGAVNKMPELKNFNTSVIFAIKKASDLLTKCVENGQANAFQAILTTHVEMTDCVNSLVNVKELTAEIEKYKPTGELDVVFEKYCNRRSTLQGCMTKYMNTMELCMDEKEKETKKIIMNVTASLLEFLCHKNGDRIGLFMLTDGPKCFQKKAQEIQKCANKTFGSYIPDISSNLVGLDNLLKLKFDRNGCMDISNFQTCTVEELEKCEDPTAANIVFSTLRYVQKITPCEKLLTA
ncbi:hypothetical protein DMN91_011291 [Ooceraea biroi]|uniref:27 kDa hemolymph glycoprotein n=1 Tax=Ooceraea biroi TaxID=2015173 RepID=A0A026WV60_OOCBI|nr:27 kDa hemolymph glycoprotein [Ooceraea biroi]EZA59546.1 27 kDa hemolymph glycoprotein [Ooceraea biroi]RLU17222.1 hypothetical protein DMN91_011291 [Ooceraea biroi]